MTEAALTTSDFLSLIEQLLGSRFTGEPSNRQISVSDNFMPGNLVLSISDEGINRVLRSLEDKKQAGETCLYSSNSYEVLARVESRVPLKFLNFPEEISITDSINRITYKYGFESDEFLVFILNQFKLRNLLGHLRIRPLRFSRFLQEGTENREVMSFLKTSLDLHTIRIETDRAVNHSKLTKLCNAFIFHICFNTNVPLVEIRSLDEFLGPRRILRRRPDIDVLEAPKRTCISDLLYHYQLALSAESSVLQFLSYYHILEHFFEKVYNDDLVERIRQHVTRADFSFRRDEDILRLIKLVWKRIKSREEEYAINEKEALELTLRKFVSLDHIAEKLNEYDDSLTSFYRDTEVEFSGGERVDLHTGDYAALASRMYKCRNAIVHSKNNEKSRFVPFRHEKHLAKEIPLIRFVAEEVIMNSSELL